MANQFYKPQKEEIIFKTMKIGGYFLGRMWWRIIYTLNTALPV